MYKDFHDGSIFASIPKVWGQQFSSQLITLGGFGESTTYLQLGVIIFVLQNPKPSHFTIKKCDIS
jgi:hypothetical protein